MTEGGFWNNKRVFLTGHTGFKGSWLALWLHMRGAHVTGYALPPEEEPNLFRSARISEIVHSTFADVRDEAALRSALRDAAPQVVFHLAAQSLVRRSYAQPVTTFATNLMGTVHLLEAVREVGSVRSVIVVTSDKCYENSEAGGAFQEDDRLGGYDPYSSSKACAEIAAAAYRSSYFNPHRYPEHRVALATARAGNVIGGGDWAADRLLPDLVRGFATGNAPVVRNPGAIRPWQHILDPLSGYMLLAEGAFDSGARYAQSWNFGPDASGDETVKWVADKATEVWGDGATWVPGDSASDPHEAHVLRLDCRKARDDLRWRPRWPPERAVAETIDWHKQVAAGADAREVTIAQIKAYEGSACVDVP